MVEIQKIKARAIMDSRNMPTIEAMVETDQGVFKASAPSGASKGKYEAHELRDSDNRGVSGAIENINLVIGPKMQGKDAGNQKKMDEFLVGLDGTENKSGLGANALLAVSMAVCRAGASAQSIPLWQYISQLSQPIKSAAAGLPLESAAAGLPLALPLESAAAGLPLALPLACFNIIEGGKHAKNELAIQEFMAVPYTGSFSANLEAGKKIYKSAAAGLPRADLGDEGGHAPKISKASQALDLLAKAIESAGYKGKAGIGIDCAASEFFKDGKYCLEGRELDSQGLLEFYQDLIKKYSILFLEDPFSQNNWSGFARFLQTSNILVVGDDLTATNPERIKEAHNRNACNAVVIKPNQIGTITETLAAVKLAKSFNWKIMVSHRSGETEDDFIADLAVGVSADFIKSGAPAGKERLAKYNRLIEIEKELDQ